MASQIRQNYRPSGKPVAGAYQLQDRGVSEVMRDLTHQNNVHTLVPDGRGTRAAHRGGQPARAGECGGRAIQLQSHGDQPNASTSSPTHRRQGQISQAGAQVQHGKCASRGRSPECSTESVANRGSAPEPAIGPSDVPQGFGYYNRIGIGPIEQLLPHRGD